MEIRPARADDHGDITACLYSAGPELYDFIYRTARHSAHDYIDYEFRSGRGITGWRNVTVAVQDCEVVGTGCCFDGRRAPGLILGTALNMLAFFGPWRAWPVLLRSLHASSLLKQPGRDELYLSNFGVSARGRGQGTGRAMLRHWLDLARAGGYRRFTLDVADNNPRARKLYESLGLAAVKKKEFSGRSASVPGGTELSLALRA